MITFLVMLGLVDGLGGDGDGPGPVVDPSCYTLFRRRRRA